MLNKSPLFVYIHQTEKVNQNTHIQAPSEEWDSEYTFLYMTDHIGSLCGIPGALGSLHTLSGADVIAESYM